MPSLLGTKGQVVIEKPIREALQLKPGFVAVQRLVGDHIEVYFLPPEHNRSLQGALAPYAQGSRPAADKDWNEVRTQAWVESRDRETE